MSEKNKELMKNFEREMENLTNDYSQILKVNHS